MRLNVFEYYQSRLVTASLRTGLKSWWSSALHIWWAKEVVHILSYGGDTEIVFSTTFHQIRMKRCSEFHHPPCLIDYHETSCNAPSDWAPNEVGNDIHRDGFSSSSMSRRENTTNFLVDVDVGWLIHEAGPSTKYTLQSGDKWRAAVHTS